MPPYPNIQYPESSKLEVMNATMHEKTVEMANEEVRNIDILRWRKKSYLNVEPITGFKANKDELLPIPLAEIDNNPNLESTGLTKQNPRY